VCVHLLPPGLSSADAGEEVAVCFSNALVRINCLDLRAQVRQQWIDRAGRQLTAFSVGADGEPLGAYHNTSITAWPLRSVHYIDWSSPHSTQHDPAQQHMTSTLGSLTWCRVADLHTSHMYIWLAPSPSFVSRIMVALHSLLYRSACCS
jgi:hypothetical protein